MLIEQYKHQNQLLTMCSRILCKKKLFRRYNLYDYMKSEDIR